MKARNGAVLLCVLSFAPLMAGVRTQAHAASPRPVEKVFSCAGSAQKGKPASGAARNRKKAAPRTTPDALIADLYRQQKAGRGPFFQTRNRARVDRYFAKPVADLIWRDAVASRGEIGALGFDPLFDTQDNTGVKNFSVRRPVYQKGKASVTASFVNFGRKETVVYKLARQGSGWKIADIHYGEGRTLSGTLKGK